MFGEPGVGKTRLLHEAATESSRRGVRVARSSCLPLTTPLPFDPVLELLRSLGEPLPAVLTSPPRELFGIVDYAHASSATALGRFDHHG